MLPVASRGVPRALSSTACSWPACDAWAQRYPRLDVRCGNVLDEPLAPYTHFYLFNPFDTEVLVKFLDKVEAEATRPVTLIHMSDNGERYAYLGPARVDARA